MAILYYGLGLHMGTPVTQNEAGELLAEVINVGDRRTARRGSTRPTPICPIIPTFPTWWAC
jgi:hypothetical protein